MSEFPDIRNGNRIMGREDENTLLAQYDRVRSMVPGNITVPADGLVQIPYRPVIERLRPDLLAHFDGEIPAEWGFVCDGRVYQEAHGGFLETSTAESTSALETIRRQHALEAYAHKVGGFLLWLTRHPEVVKDHDQHKLIPPARRVIRRTLAEDGATCGMHSNFLGDRNIPLQTSDTTGYGPILMSHIVTNLLTFAGGVRKCGSDGFEYVAGAKLTTIEQMYGTETVSKKPLINTRDTAYCDTTRYRRNHITSMDGGMWPWPEFMKLTTTSLVHRLVENGIDCSDLLLADPVAAAHHCAMKGLNHPDDINRRVGALRVKLLDGTSIHPLDLQLRLAEKCRKMAETCHVSEEEAYTLDIWPERSEMMLEDARACYEYVEFIGELVFGTEAMERRSKAGRVQGMNLLSYERAWRDLDPAISLGIKTRERLGPQRDIMQKALMPQQRTRADGRRDALTWARTNLDTWPNQDIKFHWDHIRADCRQKYILNPYNDDPTPWIDVLEKTDQVRHV